MDITPCPLPAVLCATQDRAHAFLLAFTVYTYLLLKEVHF